MAGQSVQIPDDGRLHGVVAAIRREDGRWLMIRRSAQVARAPLKVCFPGGAVESGESLEAALVREMREELGIDVRPLRCCWRWESPSTPLTIWGYLVRLDSGEPTPNPAEVAEVLWLDADQAANHPDGLPTNREFVACLMEETTETGGSPV